MILGGGILLTAFNAITSYREGVIAGANPWNADTLEWDVPSPPPAYGVLSIPTVASRHPLWDEHHASDPHGERMFDSSRLTISTSWLAAQPRALAQMPEDSLVPLWLSISLTLWLAVFLVTAVWAAAALTVVSRLSPAWWLWPKSEKHAS